MKKYICFKNLRELLASFTILSRMKRYRVLLYFFALFMFLFTLHLYIESLDLYQTKKPRSVPPRNISQTRHFRIDYETNIFTKDGKSFRLFSGSIHYFRIPDLYWRNSLMKLKAMGFNAVTFYIPWNFHEFVRSRYEFRHQRNISRFLSLANELDLLAIVRPGPYICAEWDLGGLPAWLLNRCGDSILRSSDSKYMYEVQKWFDVLLPILKKFLYENNGPIVMIQVENEYGSYGVCDKLYMRMLHDIMRNYLGLNVVLFTTDLAIPNQLECGSPDKRMLATIDFNLADTNTDLAFNMLKTFQPKGPTMNSEFYSGWITYWGSILSEVNPSVLLQFLLNHIRHPTNPSISMYVFHGGTNFGFWNGANGNECFFSPQITSYDYDAPLTESGDITIKYKMIRSFMQNEFPDIILPPIPVENKKMSYESVKLHRHKSFLQKIMAGEGVLSQHPLTMESIHQYQGYMLYVANTTLIKQKWENYMLHLSEYRDYAYIFTANGNFDDITYRGRLESPLNCSTKPKMIQIHLDDHLMILVENAGHINFGWQINNFKGIIGHVLINQSPIIGWRHYPVGLEQVLDHFDSNKKMESSVQGSVFIGELKIKQEPADTFIKLTNFQKGFVVINGYNLGRFWNRRGPQRTLYVPKTVLFTGFNSIRLFEVEGADCAECYVEFLDHALLNS